MQEQIAQIKEKALEAIKNAKNAKELDEVRVQYLGKKGELTLILRSMGGLSPEERPVVGSLVNQVRDELEAKIEEGENSKETLIRETKEEMGYALEDIEYIDNLACYYYFDLMDKYELGIMDFYKAKLGEKICESKENSEIIWVKPEKIANKMYFEYHRHFLNKYIKE